MIFKVDFYNDELIEDIPFKETFFVKATDAQHAVNKAIYEFYRKNEGIILGTVVIKNINVKLLEGEIII